MPQLTLATTYGTVVERFRQVVETDPGAVAVATAAGTTTYAELDAASDLLARRLAAAGRDPQEPVGLLLEHDVHALVGLLAAAKAGRPSVALDTTVPASRIAQIAEAAGIHLHVVTAATADLAAAAGLPGAGRVDAAPGSRTRAAGRDRRERAEPDGRLGSLGPIGSLGPVGPVGPHAPVTIAFTSGSTGRPKGVAYDSTAFLHDAYICATSLGQAPGDRIALVLPLSFGAGTAVAIWSLTIGAALHVVDPRRLTPAQLIERLVTDRITALHATPSLLRTVTGQLAADQVLADLRLVTSGGEPAFGADLAALRPHLPAGCIFVNRAGSSEAGTIAQWFHRPGDPVPDGPLPAGHPVEGVTLAVERADGSPAAPGEVGNLAVTSRHLALGYWRQPELTAARFSAAPDGRRTVRCGDLGLLRPDGMLEFRGRRDAAVKVRGYLVEPAEVEAALRGDPAVADAAVAGVPRDSERPEAGSRLVAWIEPTDASTFSAAGLRRRLHDRVPAHMVPTAVLALPALPRTERGKLDRAALPAVPARPGAGRAPREGYEALLAELWAELLGVDGPGLDDDFFDLGGDSLIAEELLARVGGELGVALPSGALVQAPTLGDLARLVAAGTSRPADLVPLATSGDGHPVHLLAGSGGLALGLLPLARRLAGDYRVYGIQAHALERRGLPDWTVGRAAARAARAIRQEQPRGPYVLGGHSAGGTIALDVARRLARAGEQVALVALLDSPPPGTVPQGSGLSGDAGPADAEVVARLREGRGGAPAGRPGRLRAAAELALTGLVPRDGAAQFQQFHRQGRWLLRLHRARPWPGRSVVYVAEHGGGWGERDWRAVLTGDWTVRRSPGRHLTMIREPHAAALAAALAQDIRAALAGIGDGTRATGSPAQA